MNIEYHSESDKNETPQKKKLKSTFYERKVPSKLLNAEKYSSWLELSNKNANYCKLCNCEIADSLSQTIRHEQTEKHQKNVKVVKQIVTVTDFINPTQYSAYLINVALVELN